MLADHRRQFVDVVFSFGNQIGDEFRQRHTKALKNILGLGIHRARASCFDLRLSLCALECRICSGGHNRIGIGILVPDDIDRF